MGGRPHGSARNHIIERGAPSSVPRIHRNHHRRGLDERGRREERSEGEAVIPFIQVVGVKQIAVQLVVHPIDSRRCPCGVVRGGGVGRKGGRREGRGRHAR